MKLGTPLELTPEELAGVVGSSAPLVPTLGPPIDALDDFDVYNATEDEKEARGYDPADPGVAGKLWQGVKDVVGMVPAAARGMKTLYLAGQNPAEAVALVTQASGKALGNYSTLGKGAATTVEKGVNAAAALLDPSREPEMKLLSRRASFRASPK